MPQDWAAKKLSIWASRGAKHALLVDTVPLRNGDNLHIEGTVPADYHLGMFAFTSEGKLEELAPMERVVSDGTIHVAYPAAGQAAGLKGPPGTEILIICGRSSKTVVLEQVASCIDVATIWPRLPDTATIQFDIDRAWITGARSFVIEDFPEKPALDCAEALRKRLIQEFEFVQGVVFPHREHLDNGDSAAISVPSDRRAATATTPRAARARSAASQQRALLVGCSQYASLPEIPDLQGPANDVRLMRQLLVETFQFRDEQIVTLAEDMGEQRLRPTRQNIVREMNNLIALAGEEDQVLIYMSGHGSQQPDNNSDDGDDFEPDGLDEIFLPADAAP